jgi:hypothetical protein
MARYMLLWEYDVTRCPLDTKEKVNQWLALADLVKKQLKSGEMKEWAHYAGETTGYLIVEGNEMDVLKMTDSFVPYVKFTSKVLLTIEQCEKVWKSL